MARKNLRVASGLMKKASLVGAFFIACGLPLAHAACPLARGLPTHAVKKVVDGDTLRLVDGRSVRLIGLNTPELASRGKPPQAFAEQARRQLEQLVAASDGQVALKVGQPARDHYGRTLAHAYGRDGRNLEEQMLAAGLGYLVAFAPQTALAGCQQAAERSARERRLGLWQRPPLLAPQQVVAGGFALIRGRVQRVERNRGGVWLEMSPALVLRVTPKLLPEFDIQALQRLAGREVEARGWVVDRARHVTLRPGQARWMLPLTAPVMLEEVR